MTRLMLTPFVAVALCLTTVELMAGGPPRLCLPVDGVTLENAADCAKLLKVKLGDQIVSSRNFSGVQVMPKSEQSYIVLYLDLRKRGDSLSLADIDAAFSGSKFSVPRDKICLFGQVTVELACDEAPQKLLDQLASRKNIKVVSSKQVKDRHFVTLSIPFADGFTQQLFRSFGKDPVNHTLTATPTSSADGLLQYDDLKKYCQESDVKLGDVRWSSSWHCRIFGAVTLSGSKEK